MTTEKEIYKGYCISMQGSSCIVFPVDNDKHQAHYSSYDEAIKAIDLAYSTNQFLFSMS